MEDEFYNLVVKGYNLKTYVRKFQELAVLCSNMVPNTEKLMEAFIGRLPRSIEGNVTTSKPQTLEEAINIAQRLMDQIIKHNSTQTPMITNESLMIKTSLTTATTPMIAITTLTTIITTKIIVTTTITTATIITTCSKIKGKKPPGLMLPPMGHLTKNYRNRRPTTRNNPQPVYGKYLHGSHYLEKKGKEKDKFYGKLILELGNEMRSSVEQRTDEMEKLVKKLGNTEDKVKCKKLKKKLEKARFSNTFIHMQNERVERDLYWTRVRAHEFYQEMIHRGFMFEERPNEAINVPIEDEKSYMSESRGSPPVVMIDLSLYHVMIISCYECLSYYFLCDDNVDAAIAAEWARQANVKNDASGSRLARGYNVTPAVRECSFAGFIKCNLVVLRGVKGAIKLRRWFENTQSVFEISKCAEGKKVKFAAATLEGPALTWWKTNVSTMGLETMNQMS
nr:reverse transcriptase domain-containing protein [Tanacetum cinerariifolium]